MTLRDLVWLGVAGYVWGVTQCLGWRQALWLRDHASDIDMYARRRIPAVFYRAFRQ